MYAAAQQHVEARYVLGFVPSREPDGRSHALRVRLRKGLDFVLRHRMSYVHNQKVVLGSDRTLAALYWGYEQDSLGATAAVDVSAAPAGAPKPHIAAVRITVPLAQLGSELTTEGRRAQLRIVLAVRALSGDETKRRVQMREQQVAIPLPEDPAEIQADTKREFIVTVPLGEGEHEIAVGVHDGLSPAATYRMLKVA